MPRLGVRLLQLAVDDVEPGEGGQLVLRPGEAEVGADGYADRLFLVMVPLVALTGQVGSARVGTDAFQEADIVGITLPVVKHSYLIKKAADLPRAIAEAVHIAETGRPGPVLVDVCVDVWAQDVDDYTGRWIVSARTWPSAPV